MGVNAYAYMMLGIEVEESDFWDVTGKVRSCKNSHIPKDPAADFCIKCGCRIRVTDKMTPSSYMIREALRRGMDPDQLFQSLKDRGRIRSSKVEISSEERFKDEPWILCVLLNCVTSMEQLEGIEKALLARAEAYGITGREVKLYSQLYWSV